MFNEELLDRLFLDVDKEVGEKTSMSVQELVRREILYRVSDQLLAVIVVWV